MPDQYCVLEVRSAAAQRQMRLFTAGAWDNAVRVATRVIRGSPGNPADTVPDEEIVDELRRDGCWASNQGDVWVYLLVAHEYNTKAPASG